MRLGYIGTNMEPGWSSIFPLLAINSPILMVTLKLEQDPSREDIEVSITYPVMNTIVRRIVSSIKAIDTRITCDSSGGAKTVAISDICYIKSLDKVAVVFCEKGKIRTGFRLYQLAEQLADKGFVQISKCCIVNIAKLDVIKPMFNSRMEAIMANGERLHVTRKYLAGIKRMLRDDERR